MEQATSAELEDDLKKRPMLRMHCVQPFYNLSDFDMEDPLYEMESVRRFGVGFFCNLPLVHGAAS